MTISMVISTLRMACPTSWKAAGKGMASRLTRSGQSFHSSEQPTAPNTRPMAQALRASISCCLENTLPMPVSGLSLLNLGSSTLKLMTQPPETMLAAAEARPMPAARGMTNINTALPHTDRR